MNLVTISGHTFDLDALPERPRVLDVGSFQYEFTNGILALRPGAQITCIEPSPFAADPPTGVRLIRAALVGNGKRRDSYVAFSSGEGNYIPTEDDLPTPQSQRYDVECFNILDITMQVSNYELVKILWDLVKLDCEGSEFSILEAWPPSFIKVANQISVEFHDYKHPDKYDSAYFAQLFTKLSQYQIVQNDYFKQGEAWGHWDTLLRWRR